MACYTPAFLEAESEAIENTYLWLPFLPFGEADVNPELADFLAAMGDDQPQSWSAGAWAAGVMFEEVVNTIVAADGPNGLTRARLLEELNALTDFDANGFFASFTPSEKATSPCYVMGQIQGGEFVRLHPADPGTFDCEAVNVEVREGYDALADFDSSQ